MDYARQPPRSSEDQIGLVLGCLLLFTPKCKVRLWIAGEGARVED